MLDSYEVSLMENVWRVWHKKQNALKIGALLAATLIVVLGFFTFKFGAEASKYKNEAAQKVAEIKELRAKNNTILEELEAWKIRARESRERAKYTASAAKENERTFEDDQGNAELKEEEAIPLDLSALEAPKNEQYKPKSVIEIKSKEVAPTPEGLKNKFESTGDVKFAEQLAKLYYAQKDYQNALKWAYTVNNLDKNAGWVIFAKALFKSGKKDEAIKVLEAYKAKNPTDKSVDALIAGAQSGTLE